MNFKLFFSICFWLILQVSVWSQIDSTAVFPADSSVKAAADSLNAEAVKDTVAPMFYIPAGRFSKANKILRSDIDLLDYRSASDIIRFLPGAVSFDLGRIGQPIYTDFFGMPNNISWLRDGIPINGRLSGAINSDRIKSESIDSIAAANLTAGFLFGSTFNSSAVNIIYKDRISPVPFSRIHFYQAPNDEGALDILFSAYVANRLNAAVSFTSRSGKSFYENTEFGEWHADAKLHYLLSNKINLIGDFSYYYRNAGLFGGVDKDSILNVFGESQLNDFMFDSRQAPVMYGASGGSRRYEKEHRYSYYLKALLNVLPETRQTVSLYYETSLREFRLNEYGSVSSLPKIADNNDYSVSGINYSQNTKINIFNFNLFGGAERSVYNSPLVNKDKIRSSFSAGGEITASLFGNFIKPGFFARCLNYNGQSYFGSGIDLSVRLFNSLCLYSGFSSFQKPISVYESQFLNESSINQTVRTQEVKLDFLWNGISADFGYFRVVNNESPEPFIDIYSNSLRINELGGYTVYDKKYSGLNFYFDWSGGLFEVKNKSTFMIHQTDDDYLWAPQFTSMGGVYYIDTLFNENLKFKTGINYYIYGARDFVSYDFERDVPMRYLRPYQSATPELISGEQTSIDYQLDFFFAGRIQDAAIVYFVFENLLDNQYFIRPYYPMPGRGIRFGVSWEFLN